MITNTIKKIILNLKIVNGLGHELVELEVPNLTEPIMEIIKNQHLISSYEKFKLSSTNLMSGIKVGELKIKGVSKSHLGGVLNLNDEKVLAVNITSKEPKFQKTIEISHSIKNLEIEKTQYFTKGFSV